MTPQNEIPEVHTRAAMLLDALRAQIKAGYPVNVLVRYQMAQLHKALRLAEKGGGR